MGIVIAIHQDDGTGHCATCRTAWPADDPCACAFRRMAGDDG